MENADPPKHGCFFKDGKRRADYAIIINTGLLGALTTYISALQSYGLQLELEVGRKVDKLFLLLHIPQEALMHFSKIYDVGNVEIKPKHFIQKVRQHSMRYRTPISIIPARERGTFTSSERITILNNLLESASYGDELSEFGISRLIKLKLVDAAYPLHDGPAINGHNDANDRQLLFYYWANFSVCLKEQPLDMINKYFGSEVAFYFAWLEFFNIMLLPAAILGTLVFIINLIILMFPIYRIKEICEAHNMWICPTCEFHKKCSYTSLASYCTYVTWGYLFDNYLTIAFAIFMSFWATFFINLWRRRQNILQQRWGIFFQEKDFTVRQEYLSMASRGRFSKTFGKFVPILRMTFTVSVCLFMILMVLAAVCGVIMFKISATIAMKTGEIGYLKKNAKMLALVIGCLVQIYGKLSIWLTDFANPRTQSVYDSSVLHMRYLLAFANNYAALFYIAFIKGRMFSLPHHIKSFRIFERDTCQPSNCITALCLQLAFLMLLKKFAGNILTLLFPKVKKTVKRLFKRQENYKGKLSQYEEEYMLLPTNRYLLTTEFCEMVIEYGFVTFFVAAFPLAPLFALLNNLLETRLDAYKLVTRFRRPVPRKMPGIGTWDGIIMAVTYLSTATNAFVIAFTSDFVSREIYQIKNDYSLKGYVNSTLSEFATEDYDLFKGIPPNPDICHYKAMRYPPSHPNKYELTEDYWVDLMWRLICVFIFEHVIFGINGFLSLTIPEVPHTVKQRLHLDRRLARRAKLKQANDELKLGKNKGTRFSEPDEDSFDDVSDDDNLVEAGPIHSSDDVSDDDSNHSVKMGPIRGFMNYINH